MALTYLSPPSNEVYAIDLATELSQREIKINFTETSTGTVGITLKNIATNAIIPVSLTKTGNDYSATMKLPAGNFEYFFTDSLTVNANPTKYNFSVGYVFVIVSHSLGNTNGEQHCTDNRVFIYNDYQAHEDADWKNLAKYTGGSYRNPKTIYDAKVLANVSDLYNYQVGPWSRLGQLLAVRDSMPVAFINCGMGGSSVEMWADEAANRPFEHGFAGGGYNLYNSGFPYIHFENVMKTFVKRNGITAILFQHGENDMFKDPVKLGFLYKTVIDTVRTRAEMYGVPFVISKSAWLLNSSPSTTQDSINQTIQSVDEALKITEYSYLGPDLHLMPQSFRGQPNNANDGHWNPDGSKEAARLWAETLTKAFLQTINNGKSTLPASVAVTKTTNTGNTILPGTAKTIPTPAKTGVQWVVGLLVVVGVLLFSSCSEPLSYLIKYPYRSYCLFQWW